MAIKIEPKKVYKCMSPNIAAASIHVIGGSLTVKGSNVTEVDPVTRKMIIPKFSELVDTGDILSEGIHTLATLPEWFGVEGSGEAWVKMGVDVRVQPGEK